MTLQKARLLQASRSVQTQHVYLQLLTCTVARASFLQEANTARAATEALAAVVRVVNDASAEGDIESLANRLVEIAVDLIDADAMTIFLVDERKSELYPLAARDLDEWRNVRIPIGPGTISGEVAHSGKPIIVVDAQRDPRFLSEHDATVGATAAAASGSVLPQSATRARSRSILCVPVKLRGVGSTTAVIEAVNKRAGGVFTKADEALLQAFASELGVLIDRKRLQLTLDKVREGCAVNRRWKLVNLRSVAPGLLAVSSRRQRWGRRRDASLFAPRPVHDQRRPRVSTLAHPRRWRAGARSAASPRLDLSPLQLIFRACVGRHAKQQQGAHPVRGQPRRVVAEPFGGCCSCDGRSGSGWGAPRGR